VHETMPMWTDLDQLKDQLFAVGWNVYDWFIIGVLKRKPPQSEEEINALVKEFRDGRNVRVSSGNDAAGYCVLIQRPGSIHQIVYRKLKSDECTVGYNATGFAKKNTPVIQFNHKDLPEDAVLLKTLYFSVNYADICIRWGVYDSANKYVGWPICPGFDVSGEIEWAGKSSGFQAGDKVFGCTFFGGYSSRVLIPARQLRKLPLNMASLPDAFCRAAAIPAVACTALHALHLAGFWPHAPPSRNRGVLIHSAAGGVGTMLCCLAKHMGANPVVGVVGREEKLEDLRALKTVGQTDASRPVPAVDYAILKKRLWTGVRSSMPDDLADAVNEMKFAAIFDANGVETLQRSYDNLAQSGRLVIYGFHTNLPRAPEVTINRGSAVKDSCKSGTNVISSGVKTLMLSPFSWLTIGWRIIFGMPKFDPMMLTLSSKAVMGFNLSFLSPEIETMKAYLDAIVGYIESSVIPSNFTVTRVNDVREGHELLSTGMSVGKIVTAV